jgi:hypothetical protein
MIEESEIEKSEIEETEGTEDTGSARRRGDTGDDSQG